MIKHVVLFGLNEFSSEIEKKKQLEKIKQALEALPDEIEVLQGMKVFFNENAEEPYDFLLEADLSSMEDLPKYSQHPAHVNVVENLIKPYKKLRAAMDYTI